MYWAKARYVLETSNIRQAATIAFLCLLVALLSVIASSQLLGSVMRSHVRDMILADVRAVKQMARQRSSEQVVGLLRQRDTYDLRAERYSLVVDAQNNALYGAKGLASVLACSKADCPDDWRHVLFTQSDGEPQELLGLLMHLDDGGRYLTAYNLRPMLDRTQIIPLLGGAGLFAVLLGSIAISLRYSLRSLNRIDRIRDALQRFASGDHRATPPHDPQGDEIDRLGTEINASLVRINRLMTEVRNVTSHIAHELRTPLTRLQNQLISAAEKVEGAMRDELMLAVDESKRIHSMFRAVMRIGEVESGRCNHAFTEVDAGELLQDLYDYYQPLAEERGSPMSIVLPRPLPLLGDRALLFQALANLADNALKYSPPGSAVELYARPRRLGVEIGVADHGPGIALEDRQRATERFIRLKSTSDIDGSGLGLSLVRAIAELHGASLQMADNAPGLRIGLLLTAA
ncbi:MAG: Sensor histidine kinase CpxA [Pseudomonas citronellolis]|nr:MAG: Sensor histidine kinase CpxA [Pseudomonas citronellolis]